MSISSEIRLGELLVRRGLVTNGDIARALELQRDQQSPNTLGQLLIAQKVLTQGQLDGVLDGAGKRQRLGDVLIQQGAITRHQLEQALASQKRSHGSLGQVLIRLGHLDETKLRQALAQQLDIPYIDLDRISLDRSLSRIVNANYARRHNLVPIAVAGQMLTVCMDDPTHRAVVEELARATERIISVVTASHEAVRRALIRLYDERQAEPAGTLEVIAEDAPAPPTSKYAGQPSHAQADVIVRQLIAAAIARRASDVHIETLSDRVQVRMRVDGVLSYLEPGELLEVCNRSAREILSRLKILAKLNIAERRRPQDGSFRVKVERKGKHEGVDLRVSVVPTHYGESLVIRILDAQNAPASLEQLHFPAPIQEKLQQLLRRPSGILLVTGPTGSGKSTTLYASLMTLCRPGIRILTAEDPIEYIFENVSQAEVNEQIGNTFATYLRAFLRHDPEVIMVGEIRDQETAEMAFRAAQTGHLLLSTLHTNTAAGAIARLMDMQIDPNTVASSLIGVVGQRLVRRICDRCRAEYDPSRQLLREFFPERPAGLRFHRGQGCTNCRQTGYRGRQTIVELWVPSDEDIILINKSAPIEEIRASARRNTLSMADSAWDLLRDGRTSLEELVRMLPYDAIADFRQRQPWRQDEPIALAV
ncbi:MAG TPA: GspE/PulE family protein [Vicinamibacterales bacterium]|jgi:type IV pilus assembly protein PilB